MFIRRKTIQRVAILTATAGVIAGGLGLVALSKARNYERELQTSRTEGMVAYHSGDFTKAIDRLDKYLARHFEDDDATLAYAVARSRVASINGENVRTAIRKLYDVLARDPNNTKAQHALLEILPLTTSTAELFTLANAMLDANPSDVAALRSRINANARVGNLEKALTDARQYASVSPDTFESHQLVLQLMARLKKPAADTLAYATEYANARPENPHAWLLMSQAQTYDGKTPDALKSLRRAAELIPAANTSDEDANVTVAEQIADAFDALRHSDEALTVLTKAADRDPSPRVMRALVVRLWQQKNSTEITRRLASLDQTDPRVDPELLALRAVAAYQSASTANDKTAPDKTTATSLHDALRKRTDRRSQAWTTALDAKFGAKVGAKFGANFDANSDPKFDARQAPLAESIDLLTNALQRDPDNGIFMTWLAEAQWNVGEPALALPLWTGAAQRMANWSVPHIGISQCLMQLGRTRDAVQAAQNAFERQPGVVTAIHLATTRFRLVEETSDKQAAAELLALVEQIQKASPGEPRTRPIQITLLARTGQRERAIAQLDDCIAELKRPGTTLDAGTVLRLHAISRADALNRDTALLDAAASINPTPDLALTRALSLHALGKSEEAAQVLAPVVNSSSQTDTYAWAIARARFAEAITDPRAADLWREVGNQYPDNLDVQRAVLDDAQSLRTDRAFVAQSIQRLKALTGPDGQQWKIQRARFLIESPDVTRDGVEAVALLTEIVRDPQSNRRIEPRLELARALEHIGNVSSAVEHLHAAQSIDPRSVQVAMELIRVLRNQGQVQQVREVVQQIASDTMTNPGQRLVLASLYAQIGDNARAIALLSADERNGALSPQGRLLLADTYKNVQKHDLALAIYESLVASPNPSTAAIAAAADFHAMRGQPGVARNALKRLRETDPQTPLVYARFEERYGETDAAEKYYRSAADLDQAGAVALVDFFMRRDDLKSAAGAAQAGSEKWPGNTALVNQAIEAQALLAQRKTPTNLQPLINALSRDPARAAEVDTLRLISQSSTLDANELTRRLRTLSDKYPRFLPLQESLTDRYLTSRKFDDAIAVARRTSDALPTEPNAARLAVRSFRAAGRWNDVIVAARQWKSRTVVRPIEPDTAIAEALIATGNPSAAVKQLAEYETQIADDVRTQLQAAVVISRAKLLTGDGASARALLAPLLRDASGRRTWRTLAYNDAPTLTEAVAWCEQIETATTDDERLSVLKLWTDVARKYDNAALLARAGSQTSAYLDERPNDVDALLLSSGIEHQLGLTSRAEQQLRKLLSIKPDHAAAANDLAYLLLNENRELPEAERLAGVAVAREPNTATYHDTLARTRMARKDFVAAQESFNDALRLNPDLIEARVGLARAFKAIGNNTGASEQLKRVEQQLRVNPRLRRVVAAELATLAGDESTR